MNIQRNILSAILCIGALFTSCTSDEQPIGNADSEPIAFAATGIATASQSRSIDGNKWGDNTDVAIMVGSTTKKYVATPDADDNTKATLNADNGVTPFYWTKLNEQITAKAWMPYSDEYPSSWTVESDQSTAENYTKSDLLTAEATATYGNVAELEFAHLLSKVTFNITPGVGNPDLTGAKVELLSVLPTLTSVGTTDSKASGTAMAITVINNSADGTTTTGSCIVPPQTLATEFVKVTLKDGGTHYGSLTTAPTLAAANEYTYNIKVSLTAITISPLSIEKWEDGTTTSAEANF